MTTTATTKRAARSGNPATRAAAAAAAKKTKAEVEAEAAARAEAEEAQRKAREQFENMVLPAPEFDTDGYEIVPDKSKLEGGTYRFKVDGQAYELPNLQYLPVALAQRMMNASSAGEADAMIFERYAPGLLEHASADQFMHVIKRWKDYSAGVGLGE